VQFCCTGAFPDRLKYAIVKPIFKKGNKQEILNYKPISLLTSFSKIIEKLIYARLHAHMIGIMSWYRNNMDFGLTPQPNKLPSL